MSEPLPIAYVEGWLAFWEMTPMDENPKFIYEGKWDWANGWQDARRGVELTKVSNELHT